MDNDISIIPQGASYRDALLKGAREQAVPQANPKSKPRGPQHNPGPENTAPQTAITSRYIQYLPPHCKCGFCEDKLEYTAPQDDTDIIGGAPLCNVYGRGNVPETFFTTNKLTQEERNFHQWGEVNPNFTSSSQDSNINSTMDTAPVNSNLRSTQREWDTTDGRDENGNPINLFGQLDIEGIEWGKEYQKKRDEAVKKHTAEVEKKLKERDTKFQQSLMSLPDSTTRTSGSLGSSYSLHNGKTINSNRRESRRIKSKFRPNRQQQPQSQKLQTMSFGNLYALRLEGSLIVPQYKVLCRLEVNSIKAKLSDLNPSDEDYQAVASYFTSVFDMLYSNAAAENKVKQLTTVLRSEVGISSTETINKIVEFSTFKDPSSSQTAGPSNRKSVKRKGEFDSNQQSPKQQKNIDLPTLYALRSKGDLSIPAGHLFSEDEAEAIRIALASTSLSDPEYYYRFTAVYCSGVLNMQYPHSTAIAKGKELMRALRSEVGIGKPGVIAKISLYADLKDPIIPRAVRHMPSNSSGFQNIVKGAKQVKADEVK